jgi:hypothetical protein
MKKTFLIVMALVIGTILVFSVTRGTAQQKPAPAASTTRYFVNSCGERNKYGNPVWQWCDEKPVITGDTIKFKSYGTAMTINGGGWQMKEEKN